MKHLLFLVLVSLFACAKAVPIDPATNQPFDESMHGLTYDQKQEMQREIIKRQEVEKAQQEREVQKLQRQEYYNVLSERFKDNQKTGR